MFMPMLSFTLQQKLNMNHLAILFRKGCKRVTKKRPMKLLKMKRRVNKKVNKKIRRELIREEKTVLDVCQL